jgi:diguanylate cyclase (GGDEF)-like protein
MTIPKKMMLALSLMIVLFLGGYLLIQKFVFFPVFQSLEQQYAKDDIDRVEAIILDALDTLNRQMYDLSRWDDTYEFIKNSNEDYINSNLLDGTFPNLNIDVAYFLDLNIRPVWAETYLLNHEGFEVNTTDEYITESIALLRNEFNKVKLLSGKDPSIIQGVFFQGGIPIAFSMSPILTSNSGGPARGYLVLGIKIDQFFIEKSEDKIKKSFEIIEVEKTLLPITDFSSYEYSAKPLNKKLLYISKEYLVDNITVLRISTQFNRKITQSGLSSLKYTLFYLLLMGILIMLIIAAILNFSIFNPLSELKRQIQYISKHKVYGLRSLIKGNDEIGVFSREFNHMLDIIEKYTRELVEENTNAQSINSTLKQLSLIDPLTQINNRLSVSKKLQTEWMASYRQQTPLTIMMVDIDYFKAYNDSYGHLSGDKCLVKVAEVLNKNMHRPHDMAARFGGEEFILILPETNSKAALKVANRIQKDIAKCSMVHQHNKVSPFITVSIGVATQIPTEGQSVGTLVEHADKALYIAKNNGRNRIEIDAVLSNSVVSIIPRDNV